MSTAQRFLEEYAKRDPRLSPYLEAYSYIQVCRDDPKACAEAEAKKHALNYLASLASDSGVSPQVISAARTCIEAQGDTDECAKAALKMLATAACIYYTGSLGTVFCGKACGFIVEFAWPYIKKITEAFTFGAGLDGIIDILTFGQGLGPVFKPLGKVWGGITSVTGLDKKSIPKSVKSDMFKGAVDMVQQNVESVRDGLWDGYVASRIESGLHRPTVDDETYARGVYEYENSVMKNWTERYSPEEARAKGLIKTLIDGPGAREFIAKRMYQGEFYKQLVALGFEKSAWRKSKQGKIVGLKAGSPYAWYYKNMCSRCNQNDMKVFGDMIMKLFVERRVALLEPAIAFWVDEFSKRIGQERRTRLAGRLTVISKPLTLRPILSIKDIQVYIPKTEIPRDVVKKMLGAGIDVEDDAPEGIEAVKQVLVDNPKTTVLGGAALAVLVAAYAAGGGFDRFKRIL